MSRYHWDNFIQCTLKMFVPPIVFLFLVPPFLNSVWWFYYAVFDVYVTYFHLVHTLVSFPFSLPFHQFPANSPLFILFCTIIMSYHCNHHRHNFRSRFHRPLLGTYPKECKSIYKRDTCTLCLLQLCSQQPNVGINRGAQQQRATWIKVFLKGPMCSQGCNLDHGIKDDLRKFTPSLEISHRSREDRHATS
jgi:hypothetical protein